MGLDLEMQNDKPIVFVGASVISLMLALHLKKIKKIKNKIVIIEKADQIGGLYRSFKYDDGIIFDYGVHIYTETANETIDQLFVDILGESQWEFLEGHRRDLSGTYFNGKLQFNTPYVDLRNSKEEKKAKFLGDLLVQSGKDVNPKSYANTKDFLLAKFGKTLYSEVFKPIVEKHYRTDPANLDPMATHVMPLGRVVIFDEDEVQGLMGADNIRPRIAFPDQYNLPECYLRQERLIYPKNFGMFNVLNALEEQLTAYGVEIYTSATVEKLDCENQLVKNISFTKDGTEHRVENVEHLYWNGGFPILANKLGLKTSPFKPEFVKTAFVNILLKNKPEVSDLYYFYNFDPDMSIFRVVNYFNYCEAAVTEKGYPMCATLWPGDYEGSLEELAIKELKQMNVITDDNEVNFVKAEVIDRGFPNPTTDFISEIDKLRSQIESEGYSNVNVVGMLAEKGNFYLTEVLEHAFSLL